MDNKSFEIEYDESTWSYDDTGVLETIKIYIDNKETTIKVKHDDYGAYVMNDSKKNICAGTKFRWL